MAWDHYTDEMIVAGIANRHTVISSINRREVLHEREIELRANYLEDMSTMQQEQKRRYAVKLESAA